MENIRDWWLSFFDHPTFWNAFWPSILGAMAGAFSAFILEHRYRRSAQIRREIGQCNKLIFTLGQILSMLEDINESMFETPRKRLGRSPAWTEVTGLVGTPDRGPDFILGEYGFLLEYDSPNSRIPDLLANIYTAEANFKQVLANVNLRTQLWYEYCQRNMPNKFALGAEAAPGRSESDELAMRLRELTNWLKEDIPEGILKLKKLLPEVITALGARYPVKHLISLAPVGNPNAPS